MKGESRPGTGGAAAVPRSIDGLFARATVHVRPARRALGMPTDWGLQCSWGKLRQGQGRGQRGRSRWAGEGHLSPGRALEGQLCVWSPGNWGHGGRHRKLDND